MQVSKIKNKYIMTMITGLFLLFSAVYVNAASMLNFSGKITDTGGMELADGVYDMKFRIYDAQTGGNLLWSEDLIAVNRFSGVISNVAGRIYTYENEQATTTLRVGQYLYNASTSEAALIVDFNQGLRTVTVASGSPVWAIGQAINNRPFVEGGIINENLGSVADIDIDFSQTRYLELEFDGEIMEPRKILDAAANAFNAERLGGQTVDSFANVNHDLSVFGQWDFENILNVATSSATTALTVNQGGGGNIVSFMRGATTSFAVLGDGQVRFENYAFPVADGVAGYVLKTDGAGVLSWQLDISSNTGSAWATSSNSTMIYPADMTQVVVIGSNATSTSGYQFEVRNGDALFEGATISNNLFVGGAITNGLWNGAAITNAYIASSSFWNNVYDIVTASSSQWQAGYNYRLTSASGEFTLSNNQLAINTNYNIPLTASTSQWVTAFGWGNHTLAGYLVNTNNLSDLQSSSTARTNLGLIIGSNIQAYDQELSELGALVKVADKTIYLDGAGNYALTAFTTMARSFVDDTNASAMRTTLGLGTMAVISDIGSTSVNTLGTISSGVWQGSPINNSYIASSSIWNATTNTVNASSTFWDTAYANRIIATANNLTFTGNTIGVAAGYAIPSEASSTNWNSAFAWGNHASAGYLVIGNNLSDLSSSSTARTNLGLGTIATQNYNSVIITGGSLDAVAIGATTAGAGTFTTLSSNGVTAIGNNSATVAINSLDWDISTTGVMAGISGITTDGGYAQSGTSANTLTGATTLSAAGTALTVTNNASVGGTLNVSSLTGITTTVATNAIFTIPTSGAGSYLAYSPAPKVLWHDRLAFNKSWGTPTFETYNGSVWATSTLDNALFSQQENRASQQIDGVASTSARWTWNSSYAMYSMPEWWVIGVTYNAVASSKDFLIESSADGNTWTTRASSTGNMANANPVLLKMASNQGDTYVRLTISVTNNQPLKLSSIRALSSRWGDQGGGSEQESPYLWDSNQNIAFGSSTAVGNGIVTIGNNSTSASGGLFFGTDVNLYRSGNNQLKTDDSFIVSGNATTTNLVVTTNSYIGTVLSGVWNGGAITNTYIASSSTWNATTNTVNASSSDWTTAYNTVSTNTWLADADFAANGLMVRSANGTYVTRTATGTANQIVVTNGDGVLDNPTFGLASAVYLGVDGLIGRDSNNYIDFSTANQIGFKTSGILGMVLDANGYVGIGTTSPSNLLTVGVASGTQFIVNNVGQVLAGEWLGQTIDIAHGGTGTSTPPTAGQLLIGNVAGEFEYISTSSLGITQDSKSFFVGTTTATSDGLFSTSTFTGYKAANDLCAAEFAGAHLCRTYDIILSIERGDITTWNGGSAWISQGPSANTANSNDCSGWKSNGSTDLGSFWSFNSSSGGEGWLTNCSVQKPLACCAWQ